MRIRSRGTTGCVLFCAVLVFSRSASAEDYPISGHGHLQLEVPKDWRVSIEAIKQPPSAVLQFKPEAGEFSLQVTAVWLDALALAKTTPPSTKKVFSRVAGIF